MVDCTKRLLDLTPYEAYQCFLQADDWKIIGRNSRRMWEDFTGTTIGQWAEIAFGLALVPAQLASYLLPPYFLYLLVKRYITKVPAMPTGREARRKNFWGSYLLTCGVVIVVLMSNDRFMLFQGLLEIACGLAIFLLGPSWWAPLVHSPKAYRRE